MEEIKPTYKKNEVIELLQKFWHVVTVLATATVFCIGFYFKIETTFTEVELQKKEIEEIKKALQEIKSDNKLTNQKVQIIEKLDDEIRHELNSLNQNLRK